MQIRRDIACGRGVHSAGAGHHSSKAGAALHCAVGPGEGCVVVGGHQTRSGAHGCCRCVHLPVVEFIPPEEFERWREFALATGFEKVASGPFVRSSYHAGEMFTGI